VAMVFGNVMLRWFADSGILISEEMSRFFFVWLTFIGAVVVMRENAHLGVDALV
jgi:TRAP-type transport system small permease protein